MDITLLLCINYFHHLFCSSYESGILENPKVSECLLINGFMVLSSLFLKILTQRKLKLSFLLGEKISELPSNWIVTF